MYRRGLIAALIALTSACHADSFNRRIEKGHAFLRTNDVASALREYRDLQTEDPENDFLHYNIGRAHYKNGISETELNATEDAIGSFKTAKESFQKALDAPEPALRRRAEFNMANCTTQLASQYLNAQQYDQALEAFKSAVKEYETLVAKYPDDEAAKKNLDHVRYQLKKLMQNPPPPQEQQPQGQQQKEQQGEQQEQQQQDQARQGEQQQQEQQKDQQPQQAEKEQEDRQGQEQQTEAAKPAPEQKDAAENAEPEKPEDRQNVDALLQSLEEVDRREQREIRNQRTDIKIKSNWW